MCTGSESMVGGNAGYASMAGAALNMIGGAMNAGGALKSGNQQEVFANYKADQAMADAEAERQMGEVRAGKIRKAGKLQVSEARAAGGASGVDVNSGSMVDVGETIQRNVSTDALTELLTGVRRANTLTATAQGYRAQGALAQDAAKATATRSLLSGAANAATALYAGNRYKTTTKPASIVSTGDYYMED